MTMIFSPFYLEFLRQYFLIWPKKSSFKNEPHGVISKIIPSPALSLWRHKKRQWSMKSQDSWNKSTIVWCDWTLSFLVTSKWERRSSDNHRYRQTSVVSTIGSKTSLFSSVIIKSYWLIFICYVNLWLEIISMDK